MADPLRALWGRVLTDGRELPPSRIEIADGRITRIETASRPGDAAQRGVNDLAILRAQGWAKVERWLAVGPPRIVTLAPERDGALETIDQLIEGGVLVSLGHSGATAAQTTAGLVAGASMAAHLF